LPFWKKNNNKSEDTSAEKQSSLTDKTLLFNIESSINPEPSNLNIDSASVEENQISTSGTSTLNGNNLLEKQILENKQKQSVAVNFLEPEVTFMGKFYLFDPFSEIAGRFKGEIVSQGEISLPPTAQVDATINANSVVIEGRFSGSINAQAVKICENSSVAGHINCKSIAIAPNSKITARLTTM
jgi:cytoskeletal protein CcmA (bactofilin family)